MKLYSGYGLGSIWAHVGHARIWPWQDHWAQYKLLARLSGCTFGATYTYKHNIYSSINMQIMTTRNEENITHTYNRK